jgi:acetolactate synthase-1/2/3 large subunit
VSPAGPGAPAATGADVVCSTLRRLEVECVFGLPGTQNARLYEAMRAAGLRRVVSADEGSAAFMATGYARASGRVGVLTTIPGPGFVYALAGIVEARHDSVPLLWITLRQADHGRAFQLQRIDQPQMAAPVVKRCVHVDRADALVPTLAAAHELARAGEPGPVLVEIDAAILDKASTNAAVAPSRPAVPNVEALAARLAASRHPVLYVGQGAQDASEAVRALAKRLRAPVLCTSSGRGVLPDTHELAFTRDFSEGLGDVVPDLIGRADLVLTLGCKFTHNGSGGAELSLPEAKHVRVDASVDVLSANYPASLAVLGRIEDVLAGLASARLVESHWRPEELASLRARFAAESTAPIPLEPTLPDVKGGSVHAFFEGLAEVVGERGVYVADAGLHQAMTRRYARVLRPRGLLCPSDFQSMGFGLPGAIGAAIASPQALVVACIGDAGLVLSMGDLLTAAREGLDLVVVVFNDGQMNLIRRQQLTNYGHDSGVAVANPDYAALAQAVSCSYFPAAGDPVELARQVFAARGLRLVELRMADQPSLEWQRLKAVVREGMRARVPKGAVRSLKRLLGRRA